MADTREQHRELVFCHQCHNEWYRHQQGLQCPQCNSEVVEIVEERSDPRHDYIENGDGDDNERTGNNEGRPPHNPLHRHDPWRDPAPDPDEPDIEHVEWNPGPGVHFARTTIRSSGSGLLPRDQGGDGLFAPFFQGFSTILEGAANGQGGPSRDGPSGRNTQILRPPFAARYPFPEHHHHIHHHHGSPWGDGWRDGTPGARDVVITRGPFQRGPGPIPDQNGQNLSTVLATLLQTMQAGMQEQRGGQRGQQAAMANFPAMIAQMLGNGTHGDAVFSDEALDRIITQMMEQTNGNSAPGPATAAAIAALPKRPADKSMMGQEGKAECSVCMDTVEIGDEVTVLPCRHWFHGECVGAWLKEHDTCPHCRQGIMPTNGPQDANAPPSPSDGPQIIQHPIRGPNRTSSSTGTPRPPGPGPSGTDSPPPMPGAFTQPGMQLPYVPGGYAQYPEPRNYVTPNYHPQPPLPQRPQSHRRSPSGRGGRSNGGEGSSGGGNGGGGVTGWFRNLRGGGSSRS